MGVELFISFDPIQQVYDVQMMLYGSQLLEVRPLHHSIGPIASKPKAHNAITK